MKLLGESGEVGQKKEILKNSQFVYIFNKGEIFCLFHSLTMETVYGGGVLNTIYEIFSQPRYSSDAIDLLSACYPRDVLNYIITDLKEKGLIVSEDIFDFKKYVSLFNRGMKQTPIGYMYIILTNECNFRCKYCFIKEGRDYTPKYMTEDLAKKGIDVFAKLTEKNKKISITFYGGEPLINPDVAYSSMQYVRELEEKGLFNSPVNMTLLTNGALIDSDTVNALLETNTRVSVSIDGPKHLHDPARKDIAGKDTFDKVLEGYRRLKKSGINPGISCTLNSYNIEHIMDIVEFISNELQPSGLGFNILLPTIHSGNPLDIKNEFAVNQLIEAFKILRERGIYEDRMMRRVKPYIKRTFYFKDCLAVGGQIVLTPDGKIGPCQAFLGFDKFFPLSLNDLHSRLSSLSAECIYENAIFNEWHHRFPLNMEVCAKCFAISVCGGGCPYASFINHGSIWNIDERVCYQAKQILEWMLWGTYDHLEKEDMNSRMTIYG